MFIMMKSTKFRQWSLCFLSAMTLAGSTVIAQTPNRLAVAVQQELLTRPAANYDLFTKTSLHDALIDGELDHVTYLKLDKAVLELLNNAKDPLISFSLPVGDGRQTFILNQYNILDRGFKVYARGGNGIKQEVQVPLGIFYRGIVAGNNSSVAAVSFTGGEVAAVFSTEEGNYNLVLNYSNPGVNRDQYLLFRDADIRNPHPAGCAVTDAMSVTERDMTTAARNVYSSCNRLRVSMNGDYRLYQRRNNDMTASVNYLTSLFNVISALYDNEGINVVMSEAVVNSAPDGYTYGGSDEVLQHFGEVTQSNFDGDLAHLVSGYAQQNGFPPLGGLAWLDVICQAPFQFNNGTWFGPYSIADNYILNNIPDLPVYSWDVEASTHEIGHNIGSPHTQSCTWPGGPIDNCVGVEDGNCAAGPPPAASGGTIMSYCHLTPAGINLALGFGPLPGNLLRQQVGSSSCLTSFEPQNTLTGATTLRVANRQCNGGQWTYFYYDNNTADESDDELLLMIQANGQDIGDVDAAGVEVSMTTWAYGSGAGRTVAGAYATGDWKEVQRSWKVTLPAAAQPTANVGIRFPFMDQDVLDIGGSNTAVTQANQLSVVAFKSAAAAGSPATATEADVQLYTHANNPDDTHWKLGSEGNYKYAEFESTYGIHGGSIGYKTPLVGIATPGKNVQPLDIYPNPAAAQLSVTVPDGIGNGPQELQVFDQLGRVVLYRNSSAVPGQTLQLDVSGLSSGAYNIRYTSDKAVFNARFVKQ